MKGITLLLAMTIALISFNATAQDFQGKAVYKTHRKVDIKLDSTQIPTEMHQKMLDMMKKQFEKTYILTFNKQESLYKEDEQLESPQPAGMVMMVVDTGASDILYKNTSENRYASQNDVYGKIFLVQDELEKHNWQLTSETKNIGDYKCYKATTTREIEVMESGISVNGDKKVSDETTTQEITITAWYTPDIPINNGPANFHGLPGLILEINDGRQTMICSKIVLNPNDKVTIKEPTKGKVVSQEKFDKIMEKKAQEMRERYNSDHGDGEGIEIRINGLP